MGHLLTLSGPVGLPDSPLRILDPSPPPATVEWLDYRQLWLISFPVYLVTMVGVLLLEASRGIGAAIRPAARVVALAGVLFTVGATSEQTLNQQGTSASLTAAGDVQVETGEFYSDDFEQGTADLTVEAEDMGGRVTPLPPHDKLDLAASIVFGTEEYVVTVTDPLVSHPLGEHTTWWGVGLDVEHHGESGIGTDLPSIKSQLAVFGLGQVSVDGEPIATGVPVHVMTAESELADDAKLELAVGMEGHDVPGLPAGHLRVLWTDYDADVGDPQPIRYLGGAAVLILLLGAMLVLVRRSETTRGAASAA